MTNDLFRDLLENRIPGHETPTTVFVDLSIEWYEPQPPDFPWDDLTIWQRGYLNGWMDDEPADPRARALWAKEQRGNGPKQDTLRNRGRVTRYKEKP